MQRTESSPGIQALAKATSTKRSREDFILPRPIGHKKLSLLVYERKDYEPHVLQSCNRRDWTASRCRLVEIARESKFFVSTHFVFSHEEDVYIGSQIADMCLADVIDGSISMTEDHASAILTQVVQALYEIARSGNKYNNLRASRVYISREGIVQLANFGPELYPQPLNSSENSDCTDVAHLAWHILSKKGKMEQESQTSRQKMLQIKLDGKEVSVDPGLSSGLVDFLKACDKRDMGLLINHQFLGVSGRCLIPLVYHAERASDRP